MNINSSDAQTRADTVPQSRPQSRHRALTSVQRWTKPALALKFAALWFCWVFIALYAVTASAEDLSHGPALCALDPQCSMPVVNRRLRGISIPPAAPTPQSNQTDSSAPAAAGPATPPRQADGDRR